PLSGWWPPRTRPEQAAGRLGTGPVAGEPPRPRGLAGRRQADRARARGRLSGTDAGRLDRPPDAVGSWRSAGIEAAEALHCREMGYDLAAARELKRRGLTPQEAYRQGLRRQAGGLGARPSSPEEEAYQRFQAAGVQPALVGEYL